MQFKAPRMTSIEFVHRDNAYRVHYTKRNESFTHEFGTQRDHSWVILFIELYCEVLKTNEWLNLDISNVEESFMNKILQKIEDARTGKI